MKNSKKLSQIEEKEIVSILEGDIIVTKLDNVFIMVSKSEIKSTRNIITDYDMSCDPSDSTSLFNTLSSINPANLDYQALITKEQLNNTFVAI